MCAYTSLGLTTKCGGTGAINGECGVGLMDPVTRHMGKQNDDHIGCRTSGSQCSTRHRPGTYGQRLIVIHIIQTESV